MSSLLVQFQEESLFGRSLSSNFQTFKDPRHRFHGIDSSIFVSSKCHIYEFFEDIQLKNNSRNQWVKYGVRSKFIWAPYAQLYSLAETPHPPPPPSPAFGLIYEGHDRRHLFVTPWRNRRGVLEYQSACPSSELGPLTPSPPVSVSPPMDLQGGATLFCGLGDGGPSSDYWVKAWHSLYSVGVTVILLLSASFMHFQTSIRTSPGLNCKKIIKITASYYVILVKSFY